MSATGKPPVAAHLKAGAKAEALASRYLQRHKLQLIDSNFRCRFGELDLILEDGSCLVIAEVRYRRSKGYGGPLATVQASKQRRIIRSTAIWLQQRRTFAELPVRFDVVAISGSLEDPTQTTIEWIKNAFSTDGVI